MKYILIGICIALTSCSALPQFLTTVEDIATDDAIEIKIDRDCFQKGTDAHVDLKIDVVNSK